MIDNQDRCEWVNVSSGTGSPRLSQTKGCKTVIVVDAVVVVDKCSLCFLSAWHYNHTLLQ